MLAYFKGKSWISKLIKWRTWGEYSHVAWIVERDLKFFNVHKGCWDFVAAGTIYESWHRKAKGARRNGVRKGVAGDLHKPGTTVDLYTIAIDDEQYTELLSIFEMWVANPEAKYDFRGVVSGFMLRKGSAHSERKQFCSELMMRGLIDTRIRFLINIRPEQTSPMDMAHSPSQRFVGSWTTGTPLPDFTPRTKA